MDSAQCYSHHDAQAVPRLPAIVCGGILGTASCRVPPRAPSQGPSTTLISCQVKSDLCSTFGQASHIAEALIVSSFKDQLDANWCSIFPDIALPFPTHCSHINDIGARVLFLRPVNLIDDDWFSLIIRSQTFKHHMWKLLLKIATSNFQPTL